MHTSCLRADAACQALVAIAMTLATGGASAAGTAPTGDAVRGIEQALAAAQQDKRGITVYVAGQTIGGP